MGTVFRFFIFLFIFRFSLYESVFVHMVMTVHQDQFLDTLLLPSKSH